jgi:hypothetical protein
MSQQLEGGQIWLDFGADFIPIGTDFRLLVPPNESDPGSHFSQPWACKVSVRTVSING